MKELLIATTNPGKLEEIRSILSNLSVKLVSLKDINISGQPEETGKTFEENAIIKAKFYADKSGLPTIADDGGLEIDVLSGEPGVKSHRWIHGNKEDQDEDLIAYTVKKLKDVPLPERGAQLRAVVALVLPNGKVHTAEGVLRGIIPRQPSDARIAGFPYRSLLYLPKMNKFYNSADLTPEENDVYNHRKKALEQLKPVIKRFVMSSRPSGWDAFH